MKLSDYRLHSGVSFSHIARLCSVSQAAISMAANGRLRPSFDLAIRIEKATGGQVGRDNWYPPRPAPISVTIGTSL